MTSRSSRRAPALLALPLAMMLGGCFPFMVHPGGAHRVQERIYPLPGALNTTPVFNSNSPEIVGETGILLSTLPPQQPGDTSVFLNQAFNGGFGLFSHHIVRQSADASRMLYLGLLASNTQSRPVTLHVLNGATFLTQPDAPFVSLPALMPDPIGAYYAGPGDRVATTLLHGQSPFPQDTLIVPPGGSALVYCLPMPANTAGPEPANGRTTLVNFQSDGPLYLSEVATYAAVSDTGTLTPPALDDFHAVLRQRVLAGPRETPASIYDPSGRVPGGFRYGRVCGVSEGDSWHGSLFGDPATWPAPGETVGFPIDAVFVKRFATGQNQSGRMLCRYGDTAMQAHANYGVTYQLAIPLSNDGDQPETFSLTLSTPAQVEGAKALKQVTYLSPANPQVMFRGTVRLDWNSAAGVPQRRFDHLVLHLGEQVPPFERVSVPPHTRYDLALAINYPADATPPQLLSITRSGTTR